MLFENIRLAFSGLWANKMRSLLTMLGIIIGIGSVIAIMTVGSSLTASVESGMQELGAGNITVSLTQKSDSSEGARMFRASEYREEDLITDEMIAQFRTDFGDSLLAVGLSEMMGSYTVEQNGASAPVSATGVNADMETVGGVNLVTGRFLTEEDSEKQRRVAVVSDVFCEELFGSQDPIGKTFEITQGTKNETFYIVGVYEYVDSGMTLASEDDVPTTSMYVPIGTAKDITGASDGYSSITVVGSSLTDSTAFMNNVENYFASFYTHNDSYTVTASSLESMLESLTEMMNTISLAIAVIAGISLLVGGIGVMNIMLVSITERTREIGTRKALGATNGSIRLQFVVESVILCLVGGAIGVAAGVGLGAMGANLLGYAASPSIASIAVAVGFSVSIGLFFGWYPANKAAKLDPIEALRYE